jgi:hypothetical protein
MAITKPDLVVQAGIAVLSQRACHWDLLCYQKRNNCRSGCDRKKIWKDTFDLKISNANSFPYKKAALVNPYNTLLKRIRLKSVML